MHILNNFRTFALVLLGRTILLRGGFDPHTLHQMTLKHYRGVSLSGLSRELIFKKAVHFGQPFYFFFLGFSFGLELPFTAALIIPSKSLAASLGGLGFSIFILLVFQLR